MSRSGAEIRDSVNKSKLIQSRIALVEKHFGDLCSAFGSHSRKKGKLRDNGDSICNIISTYAENESHNPSTKESLKEFAGYLCAVQDYRDSEIQRINAKVIDPLSKYGAECKHAKEQCKAAFAAREKEMKQEKKLHTMKDNKPSDRHTISTAEMDLHQASVNAIDSDQRLTEKMVKIERKKLTDIKNILMDFVHIELFFHGKAIEMYTKCFESLKAIDEEEDLEEFRNSLSFGSTQQQRLAQMRRTGSRQSLNSTGQSRGSTGSGHHTPQSRARSTPTPSRGSQQPPSPRANPRTTSAPPTRSQQNTPQTQHRQQQPQQQRQQQQQQQQQMATTNGTNGNTTQRSLGGSSMYTSQDESDDYEDDDDEDDDDLDDEEYSDDETPRPPPSKQQQQQQQQKPVKYSIFQTQGPAAGAPQRRK